MNIRMIAAASFNGVIGQNNNLPWTHDFPEDMAYFRKTTSSSTVIMGRRTYESIGRALPKRRNIVLTSRVIPKIEGVDMFTSLDKAISSCEGNVWIIGGSQVYADGLRIAEEIHLTTIPKFITGENLVYFPYVNPDAFDISDRIELSKDKAVYVNVFARKKVNQ